MGVWIETKYKSKGIFGVFVTPYVGVWIETAAILYDCDGGMVTPYVGVWIETDDLTIVAPDFKSLLMWECGLKLQQCLNTRFSLSHSLCGSVD